MARPPECNHNDRYRSGHCKVCTRKRLNAWRAVRAAAKRHAKKLAEFGIEVPPLPRKKKPPCDLL